MIEAHPAPIDQQIRRATTEIERYSRFRKRMIDAGRWHPNYGADVLYELRSILITLRQVQRGAPQEISHDDV